MGDVAVRKRPRSASGTLSHFGPPQKKASASTPAASTAAAPPADVIEVIDDSDDGYAPTATQGASQPPKPPSDPSAVADAPEVLTIDDDSDVGAPTAAGDAEDDEVVIVGETKNVERVVDLSLTPDPHASAYNLYFAVVRGMVGAEEWSGITTCVSCAYAAVAGAPKGASSYVVTQRRLDRAVDIVAEECTPCLIQVYGYPSVQPQLCDVICYTDGASLDGDSKICKKVFMDYSAEKQIYAGYGVWFGEDSPWNRCGTVPGEQGPGRAEMYAVCQGLRVVLDHMPWAGRLLLRIDAALQNMPAEIAQLVRDDFKLESGADALNVDLWRRAAQALDELRTRGTIVIFEWVKGHAKSYGNYKADALARAGAQQKLDLTIAGEHILRGVPAYNPKPPPTRKGRKGDPAKRCTKVWAARKLLLDEWRQRRKSMPTCPCLTGAPAEKEQHGWSVLRTT